MLTRNIRKVTSHYKDNNENFDAAWYHIYELIFDVIEGG